MIQVDQTRVLDRVIENVEKVIVGKRHTIEKMMIALLAQGHILFEDVPGVGKTRMVKALARSINGTFKRIQFTPDLLPTDVIGVSIYNQKSMEFEFKQGPIMTNILLADEINRTSPKTQSSLLEAMEERSVTVDGVTYTLDKPFIVMATQNPIEYEGTYPLPEAQMDRFMMKLHLGYPDKKDEVEILSRTVITENGDTLSTVCTIQEIVELQGQVSQVYVNDVIKEYMVEICQRTRTHKDVLLGVSPRGTVAFYKATQARAYLMERDFVTPDDVKELAIEVLAHRMILKGEARFEGVKATDIVSSILEQIPVPVARDKKLGV
ncbi:MoxR family ATPase [Ammoniphilus sp. CFH 90114]|uniref:AAA family ATPase n=1 Tax=Ammoniphilus sp. CFH 90114 TaxID=2493665 RepID=UPI0010100459|nr:MoxR family ATPase [Ammoniphilus sp. CFH 90114]RXT05178.1 MoxR family ATPase [Ammoniphilus sp. CFH 90114]